jgi:hypothetical protein
MVARILGPYSQQDVDNLHDTAKVRRSQFYLSTASVPKQVLRQRIHEPATTEKNGDSSGAVVADIGRSVRRRLVEGSGRMWTSEWADRASENCGVG